MSVSVVELFEKLARNQFGFFERLSCVSELMSKSISTIHSDAVLADVLGRKDPVSMGAVAVIDSEKRDVIGMIKHTTLLRCIPRYLNTLKEKDRDLAVMSTNVCDLASRRSISIRPSASPLEALECMFRNQTETLLVYDEPTDLKGAIHLGDFAKAMLLYYQVYHQPQQLQRLRLIDLDSDLTLDEIFCRGAQTARDVMRSPITVAAHEPVASAIRLLQDHQLTLLPVTDDRDQVTCVISLNDILIALQPPSNPRLMDFSAPLPSLVDLLSEVHDPLLSEPVSNVARGRLITVSPTTRLTETLTRLLETSRDAVVVQDGGQLLGIVTLHEVARVFRTLMRLQALKGD